ncbi:MAG: sigma-70 family RNA polymerase sigma factor [Verrucomicrobia bacterium]|nr:sigma-70 family RNA polymerase sigma factor [Verrucomicrobiota bacterium]
MDPTEADALDRADMARLATGHEAALNHLMERHAEAVFHFLCRMLANEDDANDLAQETFARVYRARESYRLEQKFASWLFTIAANLARNQLRWRARHPNVSLDAPAEATEQALGDALPAGDPSPSEEAASAERAAAVRAAVRQLPEDLRAAMVLCEWEDRSIVEAAVILETTPKAVESRLYRARQLLRERLKKWL